MTPAATLRDLKGSDQLDSELVRDWERLQAGSDALQSPFYAWQFTQIMARHRDDVSVATFQDEHGISGILPFHRQKLKVAAPVGAQISDYQGIIGHLPANLNAKDALKELGLAAYDFNHVPRDQGLFERAAFRFTHSPRVDLRAGLTDWRNTVLAQTSSLKNIERKRRKIERELGSLRFCVHDTDRRAWDAFVLWKRAALEEQGNSGFLTDAWLNAVIEDIRDTQTAEFSGAFSTLYAGDTLVAAHFGMCSRTVWHWWFPTYSSDYQKYSPGLILLLFCIEHAAEAGFSELDFGRGTQRYKRELSNAQRNLCEGAIIDAGTLGGGARALRKKGYGLLQSAGASERVIELFRRGSDRVLGAVRIG